MQPHLKPLLKEGTPEEGWRKFFHMLEDPAWVVESAFRLATKNHTKSDYVALRMIFTGASLFQIEWSPCVSLSSVGFQVLSLKQRELGEVYMHFHLHDHFVSQARKV